MMRKSEWLQVRLSPVEKEMVGVLAGSLGFSVSELVRLWLWREWDRREREEVSGDGAGVGGGE